MDPYWIWASFKWVKTEDSTCKYRAPQTHMKPSGLTLARILCRIAGSFRMVPILKTRLHQLKTISAEGHLKLRQTQLKTVRMQRWAVEPMVQNRGQRVPTSKHVARGAHISLSKKSRRWFHPVEQLGARMRHTTQHISPNITVRQSWVIDNDDNEGEIRGELASWTKYDRTTLLKQSSMGKLGSAPSTYSCNSRTVIEQAVSEKVLSQTGRKRIRTILQSWYSHKRIFVFFSDGVISGGHEIEKFALGNENKAVKRLASCYSFVSPFDGSPGPGCGPHHHRQRHRDCLYVIDLVEAQDEGLEFSWTLRQSHRPFIWAGVVLQA